MLKLFYRWLARITIILIPAGFYAVFAAEAVEYGKAKEYYFKKQKTIGDFYYDKASFFFHTLGYLTIFCNLFSCCLLALVLRLVRKVNAQV